MKKTLSLIILIVAFAAILTSAVSARHYTDGGNDYYIYTARDIINAGSSASGGLTYSYVLDEDNLGNDEVRYTLGDDVTYSSSFYADMTMPASEYFSAKEYPYVKIGYTNNISAATRWAFNFEMHHGSGSYTRHFFEASNMPVITTSGDHETSSFALRYGDIWKFKDSSGIDESDPHFKKFRFFPMGSWKADLTSLASDKGNSFTIQYIAFFKDSNQAESFEFNKNDYIPQYDHRAFMFPSSNIDTKFRPDDKLTHAEALTAIANDMVDLATGEDRTNTFGVSKSNPMYDVLGYLEFRGIIDGNAEIGNGAITVGELNTLLTNSGYTPPSTELPDTDTITRAQAAKYLCEVFGRNPDENSFNNMSIGYFSDVSTVEAYDIETQIPTYNEYYKYIMEAAYTHDPADYSASTAEKWNDAKDPYLHMAKADDVIIEDLENQFEVGRERILQTLSEYEIDPDAFDANVGTIYYVSSSEGDDGNDGKSEQYPVKNLDTLHKRGNLAAGDAVLFKRGDEWHFGSYDKNNGTFNEGELPSDSAYYKYLFNAKNNITYSCYGASETDQANGYTTKAKPKLYGSIFAGDQDDWQLVSGTEHVYVYAGGTGSPVELPKSHDVGNIVFFQKDTPHADAMQATEHPVGVFAPEEALEVYGQRIVKNISDGSIMEAGFNKLVGNGVDTWTLDHDTITFDTDIPNIGARFDDVIDQIKNDSDNTGKNPDLIYFHNLKKSDSESLENSSGAEISGYDDGDNYLYLYSENGNPGLLYDVELCTYGHAVRPANTDVTIDNIAIVCTGGHGIGAASSTNLSVTNCELGWIGGAIQKIENNGSEWNISRYGNAIEIYGTANGYNVENCYMYQAFDCGPTVQITVNGPNVSDNRYRYVQENILFKNNVLWEADLEVWLTSTTANVAETDPQNDAGSFYAALDNCVLTDNLVTGSGYGFSGYNHYKHEPCQFYGAGRSYAKHINCYIMNNKFWGSKYQIVKAVPTSIKNNQGFHWVGNTIIQTYDNAHVFGMLAENLDNCTDGGWQTLDFSNETLQKLFASKSMDSNDYMYLVVNEDPADDYLPTKDEIKEVLMNIVAISEDYRCLIQSDVSPTYYYNEYRSSNKPIEFTAVSTVSNSEDASYYWTRLTQEDNTRVFLGAGETYNAYPLGSNVYYQPIFVDTATAINVNSITGEILDTADSEKYDSDGSSTIKKLTVNYYKLKNTAAGEDMLEVEYINPDARPATGDAYFGASYTFNASSGNTTNPMWTLTVAEEEFAVSYKNTLKFNYMFPITEKVTIKEKTNTNASDTTIINTIYAWKNTDYANFTASYEIPDDCEHVSHGVLLAKDIQLLLNVESADGELGVSNGVIVGRVRETGSNELVPIYTISKSLANKSEGVTWYGRAYVTYKKNDQFFTYISKDILSDQNVRTTYTAIVESGTFGNREVYSPIIWNDEIIDG